MALLFTSRNANIDHRCPRALEKVLVRLRYRLFPAHGAISMLSFVLEGSSVWAFHSLVPLWGIVLAINLVAFVLPVWTSSPKSANGTDASAL